MRINLLFNLLKFSLIYSFNTLIQLILRKKEEEEEEKMLGIV